LGAIAGTKKKFTYAKNTIKKYYDKKKKCKKNKTANLTNFLKCKNWGFKMPTQEQKDQADKWLIDYLLGAIKVEREKKEAILIITYDPRTNKTQVQRILLKKSKGQ
jgi:hypothetical protein